MAIIVPRFEAHVDLTATAYQVKVDAGAFASLTSDDYFMSSKFTGTSTDSLRGQLQTRLAAAVAATTVAIDNVTGLLTITWGSGSHSVTFGSSAAAAAFGFDATTKGPGATVVSDRCPPGIWLPARAVSALLGPVNGLGGRGESAVAQIAQSGMPFRGVVSLYTKQRFSLEYVLNAKAWKVSQGTANSYEQFWESCLAGADGIFRYYTDSTDPTSYLVGATPRDYMFGGFEQPTRSVSKPSLDSLWDIAFNALFFKHS